jgi:UDP-N-acetylglucosamine 4,6-dehydratase/5-epimerase
MRIFVTGLTGTLGTALAKLHHVRGDQVWGCSRSEARAVEWLAKNSALGTLYLCDVGDLERRNSDVGRLLHTMDMVYHCAALKHVDACERQPSEAVVENVWKTEEVAIACKRAGVPLVFVSSDKACLPQGVYGCTKLLAERIVLREGGAVVRLGNLVGSSGSVFHYWREAIRNGNPIRVTDPNMTRYFVGIEQATEFIADRAVANRVVIPNPLKAARMGDVAEAVNSLHHVQRYLVEVTGARLGETTHQWLVAPGEPVEDLGDLLVLGGHCTGHEIGRCSATAPRWDVGELLALAGM